MFQIATFLCFLPALTIYHRGIRVYNKDEILQSGWLTQEVIRGPLGRGVATRKKRYFILTQNSLDIYNDMDLQRKVGGLALSSLCSVTVPDDKAYRDEGMYQVFSIILTKCHCSFLSSLFIFSYVSPLNISSRNFENWFDKCYPFF